MVKDLQELARRNPVSFAILLAAIPLAVALGAQWWLTLALAISSLLMWRAPTPRNFYSQAQPLPKHLAPEILSEYLDRSEHPMLFLSIGDRITHYNKAFENMFPSVSKNIPVANIFRNPELLKSIETTRVTGMPQTILYESPRHTGKQFSAAISVVDATFSRIFDATLLLELHDQTEIYRMEKARRDFVANASHELRTPLAAIKGGLETIDTHRDDPDALNHFLPIMQKQSKRMERMIEDLMSLSSIEGQALLDAGVEAELGLIVKDVIGVYKSKGKGITKRIQNDLKKKKIPVNADADQIQQVLTNLIDNALKYGSKKGNVTISIAPPNEKYTNMVGLSVSNEGEGIDPQHVSRLTERFYRVNGSDKSGTGLGLAIVKQILLRHGGELQITSQPNEGAVFTIWLRSKNS